MAKVTRSTLKSYFETGDQPTESEFKDVFDSTLNLSGSNAITGSLIISGSTSDNVDGSAVGLRVHGNIVAENFVVSSSVTHITTQALSGSSKFGDTADDTHDFIGNITASNNISASGIITAEGLLISDDATITDDLTVNGDIDLEGNIDVNGITNLDVVDIDGAVDMASTLVVGSHITSSGNITAVSASFLHITASTIDVDADTINIGGTPFNKLDVDNLKLGRPLTLEAAVGGFDSIIRTKAVMSQLNADDYQKWTVEGRLGTVIGGALIHDIRNDAEGISSISLGKADASTRVSVTGSLEISGSSTLTNWGNFRNRLNNDSKAFEVSTNPFAAGGFKDHQTAPSPSYTGSAPHLHFMLSGSGQAGIGLLNPKHTLHVSSSSNTFQALYVDGSSTFTNLVKVTGDISASGTVEAISGSFTKLSGTLTTAAQPNITSIGTLTTLAATNVISTGNITASGNISASGTIFASKFESAGASNEIISFNDNLKITGAITASGGISASGELSATTVSDVLAAAIVTQIDNDEIPIAKLAEDAVTVTAGTNLSNGGTVTLGGSITLDVDDAFIKNDADDATTGKLTTVGLNSTSHISASGNITSSGVISAGGGFIGNITGDLTGDATGLTGTPSISVTNITASGNISSSGIITANQLHIKGTTGHVTFDSSTSGDLTIDAADDIKLDAGGNDITYLAGGVEISRFSNDSSDLKIVTSVSNKNIILAPNGTGQVNVEGNISSSGTVQGLTGSFGRVEATRFIGDLTGEADTVATIAGLAPNTATTQATQGAITSLGTLTGLNVNGQITASGNIKTDGFMLADYYVANTATTASAGINQAQATLLNHEAGIQFVSTDDSAKGVILPGVAEVPIGTTYTIHNVSSGSFHVYPKSSDRIFPLPADNLPATVPSSGSISITAFSSDGWRGFIGTLIS